MRRLLKRVFYIAGVLGLTLILTAAKAEERQILEFKSDDSLEAVRAKIANNGYSFEVGHNWVFDMPTEMKREFFSRHRGQFPTIVSDATGPLEEHLGKVDLPSSFDWRNYNGHSYIGPIRNQGNCGSCYAFGACAAAEGVYNVAFGLYDSSCVDFSESFIIWCLARLPGYGDHFYGCDGADYDYMELQALTTDGVCTESSFPYTTSDPQTCTHWGAPRASFSSWYRVPCGDIGAIKTAIMTYGAVDAAVYSSTSAFTGYMSGIYNDSNNTCQTDPCYYADTDHAIALVGWNDADGGYWILRNSWGASWGENGYMRIQYNAAHVACEVAYLAGAQPMPTLTPTPISTPTPTPTMNIESSPLTAGQYFTLDFLLTQQILQSFDFYMLADTPYGIYTIFPNGSVKAGVRPVYSGADGYLNTVTMLIRPAVAIPDSMYGSTVTFYAAVVQAGKQPVVRSLSEVGPATPYVILLSKDAEVVN